MDAKIPLCYFVVRIFNHKGAQSAHEGSQRINPENCEYQLEAGN